LLDKEEEITCRKSNLFFHLLEYKYSPIFPQLLTIKEDGKYLLELLTCFTLTITAICDALKSSIKNVISSMIDVLSDPEVISSSSQHPSSSSSLIIINFSRIFPIIFDFFQWCKQHNDILIKDSREDEIITSVNTSLRAKLKNESYSSPNDIIVFYHQQYKEKLTNMSIPLQPYSLSDIEQAKKDIVREKIIVNKTSYSSQSSKNIASSSSLSLVTSSTSSSKVSSPTDETAWNAIREEIKKVLVYVFEIDNVEVFEFSSVDLHLREKSSSHPSMLSLITATPRSEKKINENLPRKPSQADLEWEKEEDDDKGKEKVFVNGKKNGHLSSNNTDEKKNDNLPTNLSYPHDYPPPRHLCIEDPKENNALNENSLQQLQSVQQYNWDLIEAMNRHIESPARNLPPPSERVSSRISGSSMSSGHSSLDELMQQSFSFSSGTEFFPRFPHISASSSVFGDILELLHCHIVLAASRTIAAGDAFIILNDLYGGDGLLLCPNPEPRKVLSSSAKSPSRLNGTDITHHPCDISVAITTTGIKVILKERYRLYASTELDHCTSSLSYVAPLMSFECITTTLLLLSSEVYLSSSSSRSPSKVNGELSSYEKAVKLLNVLVTDPDRICHRAVTIEPYVS
jgi:hypothetical protein